MIRDPFPRAAPGPPGLHLRERDLSFVQRRDVAGHLAAFLHEDLPVADLAPDAPARVDHELLPRGHLAMEDAADLGDVDVDLAFEGAVLGDLDRAAHHRRLDAALDDERVAIVDLDTLQLDVRTDD